MTESLSQKEFNHLIMLIALVACFKPGEDLLSEDQIISRGYAPTEQFGKSCIASLIDSGVIDFVRIDPAFPLLESNDCTLFIRCPAAIGGELDSYTYRHTEKVTTALAQSEIYKMHLKMLRLEIIACECIEYCEFYAKRANLLMINASHSNTRLRLLLLECGEDIVHRLMWQAVKIMENKIAVGSRCIEFSNVIEICFDRYAHYKKANSSIEGYKRPAFLKTSVISGFIELYRKDK